MTNKKQPALFDDRFIESFAGASIINDQRTAIIELIANAWDAGATEVLIQWPVNDGDIFSIKDNGHGMTEFDFNKRFRTLAYNRIREQGSFAEIPPDHKPLLAKRPAFGKNGKGRLGAFAFGESFLVETARNGQVNKFRVTRDYNTVLSFLKIGDSAECSYHGTQVTVEKSFQAALTEEEARQEIGMRFLADPHFTVFVNGIKISFSDIPDENVREFYVDIDANTKVKITVIDVQAADRSTQLHGIAWHVKRRLVGECTWKGSGSEHLIDGRRVAAKRYLFIVEADCLENSVFPDWTTFISTDPLYKKVSSIVQDSIKEQLLSLTRTQREESFKEIEQAASPALKKTGIVVREKWETFIRTVQEECPSISQDDLEKLSILLIKLENSTSKYALLDFLSRATVDELDDLQSVLQKWNIDFAKIVLDEIEFRTTLLEKLQAKVLSSDTDEVQDLQPLFYRGLWIFGPEYETIQFTSNRGMTSVIQELFGRSEVIGSRNRPDFAILPDGTVGLYGLSKFDETGLEIGIDRLTIVELKKPNIPIGDEQKSQAWKYVSELSQKGLIMNYTNVTCFVLGSEIDPNEADVRTHRNGNVKIYPITFDVLIRRAKSRLLNLHDKIRHVSFLENTRIRQFLDEKAQATLF